MLFFSKYTTIFQGIVNRAAIAQYMTVYPVLDPPWVNILLMHPVRASHAGSAGPGREAWRTCVAEVQGAGGARARGGGAA